MEDVLMILIKILSFMLAIGVVPMAFKLYKTVWKHIDIYGKVCLFTIYMAMVASTWAMLYYCFK